MPEEIPYKEIVVTGNFNRPTDTSPMPKREIERFLDKLGSHRTDIYSRMREIEEGLPPDSPDYRLNHITAHNLDLSLTYLSDALKKEWYGVGRPPTTVQLSTGLITHPQIRDILAGRHDDFNYYEEDERFLTALENSKESLEEYLRLPFNAENVAASNRELEQDRAGLPTEGGDYTTSPLSPGPYPYDRFAALQRGTRRTYSDETGRRLPLWPPPGLGFDRPDWSILAPQQYRDFPYPEDDPQRDYELNRRLLGKRYRQPAPGTVFERDMGFPPAELRWNADKPEEGDPVFEQLRRLDPYSQVSPPSLRRTSVSEQMEAIKRDRERFPLNRQHGGPVKFNEGGIASLGSRQEMVPVDPSLRDRLEMFLSDTFGHSPVGRRRANMFMRGAEWIPGVDEGLLFSDAGEAAEQGNYIESGLLGGAGLLSVIPGVPPGSGRSLKEILASIKKKLELRTKREARGEYEFIPPPPDEIRSYPTGSWGARKDKKNVMPDAAALRASAARQGYETDSLEEGLAALKKKIEAKTKRDLLKRSTPKRFGGGGVAGSDLEAFRRLQLDSGGGSGASSFGTNIFAPPPALGNVAGANPYLNVTALNRDLGTLANLDTTIDPYAAVTTDASIKSEVDLILASNQTDAEKTQSIADIATSNNIGLTEFSELIGIPVFVLVQAAATYNVTFPATPLTLAEKIETTVDGIWGMMEIDPNDYEDDDELLELYGYALEALNEAKSAPIEATSTYSNVRRTKAADYFEQVKAAISSRGLEIPTGTFTQNVTAAGRTVGGWMDRIFDFLGIRRPDYAVVQAGPGGTLIWGTPQGNAPFSRIGTTPGGTVTGIQTGIPALDRILSNVADVLTGRVEAGDVLNTESIEQMVIDAAGDVLSVEPGTITVADIKGAVAQVVDAVSVAGTDETNVVFSTAATGAAAAAAVVVAADDTVVAADDTVVAADDTVVAADDTVVAVDDTVVAVDDTVVVDDDTVVVDDEIVDPPAAITLGAQLKDIVLGADVSQKEKVGGGQQRIDAGGNVDPAVQTGDEISAVNIGGDVLGSDVGGGVLGTGVGGGVSGDQIGGGVSGDQIGGGVSGDQIGGGISGDRLGGALSWAGAGGDYSKVGAGGATSGDRVGANVLGMGVGGGDRALDFGGGDRALDFGGDRTDLIVGDRLYDLVTGGADTDEVFMDEVTLGGATSSDKTLKVGGDKVPGSADELGWLQTPSPTGMGYRGIEGGPGDIMELDSIIDTPYSPYSYSEIVAYIKANARKAEEEANI